MPALCTIQVQDEVNVRLKGLDDDTLDGCVARLTYNVPNARFMMKVRMGHWKGTIALCKRTGKTYLHLLPKILPFIEQAGYKIAIEDHRRKYDVKIPKIDKDLFAGFKTGQFQGELEDHQVASINAVTKAGGGIMELATAAGKTVITAALAKLYQPHGKVLVIVPRIDLAIETQYAFRELGIDAGLIYEAVKDFRHVTVTTWQSAALVPEIFAECIAVVCDECHEAKATVLRDLLTNAGKHVPFRIGLTGTMPDVDLHYNEIVSALGPVTFEKRAYELQESGFLSSCFIHMMKLLDTKNPAYRRVYHEEINEELKWHFHDETRMGWLGAFLEELRSRGNTLVLVRLIEYGEKIVGAVPGSVFLHGKHGGKERVATYREVNASDNELFVCTYGIASTGINVPRIFNLVLIEPGTGVIKLIQSIGRGLRKASDKDHVDVWHVCSDGRFMKKHISPAKRIYEKHKYPFKISEVDYYAYTL